jgi:hypothetical protein
MRFAYWLGKATGTYSDFVELFHVNINYTTPPNVTDVRKLPVLFLLCWQIVMLIMLTIKFLQAMYKRTQFH